MAGRIAWNRKTTTTIISEILEEFPQYDCTHVCYLSSKIPIQIVCPVHGLFKKAKSKGYECQQCSLQRRTDNQTMSLGEFIKRALEVHGDFPTYPDNHWLGSGCPDCSESGFSCNRPALFYVMHCEADSITKVGITNTQVDKRNKVLNRSYGKVFKLLKVYKHSNGSLINKLETEMLRELRLVYNQPTHKFKGYSESFYDVNLAELLNKIKTKIKDFNDEIT